MLTWRIALLSTFVAGDGDVDTGGQSTFVAPDKSIAFGFTVPEIRGEDTYFTLRVPVERSWGAIGLGARGMDKALILMIYVCHHLIPTPPSPQRRIVAVCRI